MKTTPLHLLCRTALCTIVLAGCKSMTSAKPTPTSETPPTLAPVMQPSDTPLPPTSTYAPTATQLPTATWTPTSTRTASATPTRTITPTPACLAENGEWKSQETASTFGALSPLLAFTVSNCKITSWEIWTFPLPGELLWWTGTAAIPITENHFSHDEDTGEGIFTIQGTFDSATSCRGTLDFPKGFSVFGAILTRDVSISWTASPN